jgi:hypothetical protein
MRPGLQDTLLFFAGCLLSAFGGCVLAQAVVAADSPWDVLTKSQWFLTAVLGFAAASLAYRAAMSKVWQDRDSKIAEEEAIGQSITYQFRAVAFFALDFAIRLERGAHPLSNNPSLLKQVFLQQLQQLIVDATQSMDFYRENLHRARAPEAIDLIQRHSKFFSLDKHLRTAATDIDQVCGNKSSTPQLRATTITSAAVAIRKQVIETVAFFPGVSLDQWLRQIG